MTKFDDFDLDLKVSKNNDSTDTKALTKPLCTHQEICTGTVCAASLQLCPTLKGCSGNCISTKDCSTKVCPGSTGRR